MPIGGLFRAAAHDVSNMNAAFSNACNGYGLSQAPVVADNNNMTLMHAIGVEIPEINTGGTHMVSLNTAGANITAEASQVPAQTTVQDCQSAKAVVSDGIKDLQNTIAEFTKQADVSPAVFPKVMADPSSFAFEALMSAAFGPVGNVGMVNDVVEQVNSSGDFSSPAQALAAIEAAIRAQAAADSSPGMQAMNASAPAHDPNEKTPAQQVVAALDNGHSLQDIMAMNPYDPPIAMVPEFHDIDAIEAQAQADLDGLKNTENQTADRASLDTTQDSLVVNADLDIDRSGGTTLEDVTNTLQSKAELSSSQGINASGITLISGAATHVSSALSAANRNTPEAGNTNEPPPEIARSFDSGAGGISI